MMDAKQNKCICPGCAGFVFMITTSNSKSRDSMPQGQLGTSTTSNNKRQNGKSGDSPPRVLPTITGTGTAVTAQAKQDNGQQATAGRAAMTVKKSKTTKDTRKEGIHHETGEKDERATSRTLVQQPFCISANLVPNNMIHGYLPEQCCIPYYPFYCHTQYRWRAENGPALGLPPPPHNLGCPGQRVRGTVTSPFLNLYPC